tara:strand:+ start:1368 stop:3569 length:2202 start_codon:yes stop_codon:yes gene_type:complete
MKIRLLKKYIKESLGREIMSSPKRLSLQNTAADQQRFLTKIKTIDKTKLSLEEILEELIIAAGPETYIRYQNNFGDAEVPPLEVSPKVKYQTPHGIYGYPLNQNNLQSIITRGQPTRADFATNYNYFHVYKIDTSKTANVKKDKEDLSVIQGKYTNKQKVIDDIAECIRLSTSLIKDKEKEDAILQDYKDLEKDIKNLKSNVSYDNYYFNSIFTKYSHLVGEVDEKKVDEKQSLINIYKFEIADAMYEHIRSRLDKFGYYNKNVSKQYSFFVILKDTIGSISSAIAEINEVSRGQYYSILLKAIGIQGITDDSTSTIHGNEPSQSVSFDFSGDTITPVGTFRNIFKKNISNLKETFNTILKDLIDNGLVNWSPKIDKSVTSYDYKNLSLKSFNTVIKTLSENRELFVFITEVASQNVNKEVVNFIYKNYKTFKDSSSGMNVLYHLLDNKNVDEKIMNDYYNQFVKDLLDSTETFNEMYHKGLGCIAKFVTSPSLPKSIQLDIVNNSELVKRKGQMVLPEILGRLQQSRVLDKETCIQIFNKFGYEKGSLIKNRYAPISDYLIDELDKFLDNENILDKTSFEQARAMNRINTIFINQNTTKDELLYVCEKIDKLIAGRDVKNTKSNEHGIDAWLEYCTVSLIQNKNFSKEILDAMNITLEEEINILSTVLEYELESSESFEMPFDFDDEPKKFDLIKDGLPYLENKHPKSAVIKKNLPRAYNYLKNAAKYGIFN